jgi:F-type H+-transporting ATPase subunit delta
MHGSSADSLDRLTAEVTSAVAGGADGAELGDGLFAASGVLLDQPSLRRALTDPSTEAGAKSGLAEEVFGKHLPSSATSVVAKAAGLRWTSSNDLASALEHLGVVAVVKGADVAGEGDRVEAELFAFGRTVTDNPELRSALSDPARSVADKQDLVRSLLEGKAADSTVRLAAQAVAGSHLTVTSAIDEYVALAARTRDRLVALVRVAAPLSDSEHDRLAKALAGQYGRDVHLNVVVDPSLIGGVHVAIGDEVIDGTISGRLDEATRRLAG